jgi:hypothetical protein
MLGPWVSIELALQLLLTSSQVLRNICGPVDLGSRKNGVSAPQGTGFYEYDFLASKSTHKTPRLEDIDSVEVSSLIHSGFIFWNPEDVEPRNDWCPSPGRSAIADPVEKDDVPDFQWSEATLAPLSRAESEKAAEFAPSEEDAVVMILDASSGSLNSGPEGNAAG